MLTPRGMPCVVGLRSIGTSLSAVIAGSLEELGCSVMSFTLRPRGHPFDRRPLVTPELAEIFQREREATFLLIDEGPGISGSSLASTAELLSHLGIADDRIVLFPSWATDGSGLKSPLARDRWTRHKQFVVDFDEVWLASGRLTRTLPPGTLREFSAGAWRNELCADPDDFPAVQPQHERRKYLYHCHTAEGADEYSWLSFLGLGARLRRVEAPARAAAGGSRVHGCTHVDQARVSHHAVHRRLAAYRARRSGRDACGDSGLVPGASLLHADNATIRDSEGLAGHGGDQYRGGARR